MKRNIIEFISHNEYKDIICEPYPSYKNFPSWFSNTKLVSKKSECPFVFLHRDNFSDVDRETNVTGCPGIIDYSSMGYIVPSWNNFLIRNDNNQLYITWEHDFRDKYSLHETEHHIPGFSENEKPKYGGFSKLFTPWYIKTSPGISCLITHPVLYRETRFTTSSGIMHTDKYPVPLTWFFEWNNEIKIGLAENKIPREQLITIRTPLIHIIPFQRKDFNSEVKYLDNSSMNLLKYKTSVFLHDWSGNSLYNKFRKTIKNMFR